MRIRTSASLDGSSRISWSQPMPVWRSASALASAGVIVDRLLAPVEDDEVVAETVHLVELPRHARAT